MRLAELNPRLTLAVDVAVASAQLMGVALLSVTGALDARLAFAIIGAASILGVGVWRLAARRRQQLAVQSQIRPRPRRPQDQHDQPTGSVHGLSVSGDEEKGYPPNPFSRCSKNRVGRGSRFAVSLPLAAPRIVAQPSPIAAADLAMDRFVVVIDDDALVLDSMQGVLKSWGFSVVTAKS